VQLSKTREEDERQNESVAAEGADGARGKSGEMSPAEREGSHVGEMGGSRDISQGAGGRKGVRPRPF